jgi:hypothetical protein
MRLEDLINIKKVNVEKEIQDAIEDTKDELNNLTTDTTCMIYSDYLSRNLTKRHVVNRVVSTKDYNYPYKHTFTMVPETEDKEYLIDLTYPQFQDDMFEDLLQKGYMKVSRDLFTEYLEVVGNKEIEGRKTH